MKKYLFLILLTLSPLFTFAETPAIRPDVEELLSVMRVEKTMQDVMEQVKKMMASQMAATIANQAKMTPEDTKKMEVIQGKIFSLIQDEMSWQKIKGDLGQVYAESLTPDEVKGITAFYKSPAGQAFLDKQPIIVQKSMAMQQKMMANLMPKIQALVQAEVQPAAKSTPAK